MYKGEILTRIYFFLSIDYIKYGSIHNWKKKAPSHRKAFIQKEGVKKDLQEEAHRKEKINEEKEVYEEKTPIN